MTWLVLNNWALDIETQKLLLGLFTYLFIYSFIYLFFALYTEKQTNDMEA